MVNGRVRSFWRASAASGLQELYRELRRHAGNERLPLALRRRLREAGQRAYARSLALRSSVRARYPRRALHDASTVAWAPQTLDAARAELAAAGVTPDAPLVAFEMRTRPAVARVAIRSLVANGYTVIRIGNPVGNPLHEPGVIDLSTGRPLSTSAVLRLLADARFAIVSSLDLQQLAYSTNTPSLAIDAVDPFMLYPIRGNGLFLLATAVDLDSGRELPPDEWLTEGYFRSHRSWGHRGVTADELLAAIGEMQDGVTRGWDDSDAQARFRRRALDTGRALAAAIPFVAEWGPDDGFLGDGRLARVQAERMS